MILSNEFTVGADVETVWRHLLDMEGVASCLPGATIEPTDDEDTYNGSMRVRMGPMTVDYRGTASFVEIDEQAHRATISLRAREKKGQGTAMATIENRLEPDDEGTRVIAETDLHITGPQAQFGRGVLEDVGGRVLAEFSARLESRIAGEEEGEGSNGSLPQSSGATGPQGTAGASGAGEADDALDLGSILAESMVGRYARIAVAVAAVIIGLGLLRAVCARR
jgi:carbon monoxide dehydrogenase subunit G